MKKVEQIQEVMKLQWGCDFQGFTDPRSVNWDVLMKISKNQAFEINSFTLNKETLGLDFEKFEPTILYKEEWVDKPRGKIFEEVIKEYGNTHHIPGVEYQQWLNENPAKVPPSLKNEKWYYTPGTVLGNSDGNVLIPCGGWGHDRWDCSVWLVQNNWQLPARVVLLPK